MKYFILILSLIYIIPVKAQVTWIGTHFDRNHLYMDPTLESEVYIYVNYLEGLDPQEVVDSIKGQLTIGRYYLQSGKGEIENSRSYPLQFQSDDNGQLVFKAEIPAENLDVGRYTVESQFINRFTQQEFRLSYFTHSPQVLTVGPIGILSASVQYKLESNSSAQTYGIVCPENTVELLPLLLEGVFTHGFCSDEIAGLQDFSVQLWLPPGTTDEKVFVVLRSEKDNVLIRKELGLVATGSHGKVLSEIFPHTLAVNDSQFVEDRLYYTKDLVEDLLKLVSNETGVHTLYFTLELEQGGDINNLVDFPARTNYEIVEAPTGADCQAFLLPIEMVDFDIYEQKTQVFGYWVVALEVNCEYYIVEKSRDAWNWITLAQETPRGINGALTRYEFLDKTPWPGISYYRIRQVDVDGTLSYSRKKAVHIKSEKLRLFPNPFYDRLQFSIEDPEAQYEVKIFNDLGACVNQYVIPGTGHKGNSINLNTLPSGVYYIKYTNIQNYLSQVEKFIKL